MALANRNISNSSITDVSVPSSPVSPTNNSTFTYPLPGEAKHADVVPTPAKRSKKKRLVAFFDSCENALPWAWFLSDKVHQAVGGFAIVSFFYFIGLLVWALVAGVENVIPHGYARLFVIQMPVLLVLVLLTGVVCPVVLWSLKDFDDMYGIRRDCFFNIYGIFYLSMQLAL